MRILWASEFGNRELNRSLYLWASQKIFGTFAGFGPCATMGIFDGDELIAVMVYHNFNSRSGVVEISGAATDKRWLTRDVLKDMFARPFEAMGCQMIVLRVSVNDKPLARMLTAYGCSSYTIPRLRGRFEDETVFTLTDTDWMNSKFNRRIGKDTDLPAKNAQIAA